MAYNMMNLKKIQKAMAKKQATIEKRSRALKNAPVSVSVGWDKSSGKYTEQRIKEGRVTIQDAPMVVEVALTHEYGIGNHTEKAFIRNTIKENKDKWNKQLRTLYRQQPKTLSGKPVNWHTVMSRMGKIIKSDLKAKIIEIDLRDTDRLLESIIIKYHRR